MKTIMAGGAAKLQLSKSVQGLIGQVLLEDQLTKLYQLHMTNAYTIRHLPLEPHQWDVLEP